MAQNQLLEELKEIKKEINSIKKNMVDKDMILSQDDFDALTETAREKKAGKLIDSEQIEKEFGIC